MSTKIDSIQISFIIHVKILLVVDVIYFYKSYI